MTTKKDERLFYAPYRVVKHEHVDDKFVKVVVRCLGYPTEGVQPIEWEFALRVPRGDLVKWPISESVRLALSS